MRAAWRAPLHPTVALMWALGKWEGRSTMQEAAHGTGGSATTSSVVERAETMQAPKLREFALTGLYESLGAEVLRVDGRKAGVLVAMPAPDGRKYMLTRRKWSHLMHRPAKGWALSEALVHELIGRNVGWIRLEVYDRKRGWLSWEATTDAFLQPDAIRIHHPPFERQILLPLGGWIYVDPKTLMAELLRWPTPSKARRRPA